VGTLERIQTIIAGSLGIPEDKVDAETKSEDLAQWDSLHHFMIMMEVEEAFGLKFSLQELAALDSVQKILSAVQQRAAA
jgi:acyl carrier protein